MPTLHVKKGKDAEAPVKKLEDLPEVGGKPKKDSLEEINMVHADKFAKYRSPKDKVRTRIVVTFFEGEAPPLYEFADTSNGGDVRKVVYRLVSQYKRAMKWNASTKEFK